MTPATPAEQNQQQGIDPANKPFNSRPLPKKPGEKTNPTKKRITVVPAVLTIKSYLHSCVSANLIFREKLTPSSRNDCSVVPHSIQTLC
jgi:hypothetical protein